MSDKKQNGKNYEKELPAGYRETLVIDATEKKFVIIMNIAALVIMAVFAITAFVMLHRQFSLMNISLSGLLLLWGGLLLTIVCHELLHGAAYKLLTGEKLTFGLTLSVAYCGVPHIYVYRRAALTALLTPFVVFTILFTAMLLVMQDPFARFCTAIVFGIHTGGCIGDLYDTYVYLTRLKDPATLMQDTGPKQTFYVKE